MTKRSVITAIALCALNPATASETSTYTYDALGRLVTTANVGGPRNGNTVSTRFDPAGNRAAVAVNQALPTENTAMVFSIGGPGTIAIGSPANFTISKSGPASANVSLSYSTANGTAVTPTHYTAASGTLLFRPWETSKTISVATIDPGGAAPSRNFSMSISAPSAGGSLGTSSATATIAASGGTAPIANPDNATVGTCANKVINVTANDTDPSGSYPLTVISVTAGAYGTASVASATSIRYVAAGAVGNDQVTYTVRNAAGYTATGTLDLAVRDLGGCL